MTFREKDFMLGLLLLVLTWGCAGKKATQEVTPPATQKASAPIAIPNKNEIKAVVLRANQKTTFASDFKHNSCEYGKIPIQDADTPPIYNFAPAVICTVGKVKYFTSFDEHWAHYEFSDSAKVHNSQIIFAVLDYGIEGGVETVPVLRTSNGGKSWRHVGDLHKPHFSARVEHLNFTSAKVGKALLEVGETEKYIVDTKNGGKSWSAPYVSR